MNRRTLVGIIVGAVLVVGIGGAVVVAATGATGRAEAEVAQPAASQSGGSTAEPDSSTAESSATSPEAANVGAGVYLDYSPEAFAAAEGTRVLFFHAPWCPNCRALEADIMANGVPDGVTVLKVDYDSSQELKQKYGVTIQTTMVSVDQDGDKVDLFVASSDPSMAAVSAALALP